MGIDLQTVIAAITGGAQGLATADQQDQARKRQLALDAMNAAVHKSAMDKQASDTQHQQGEDFLKGIRPGTAPRGQQFADAGSLAGGVADSMSPIGVQAPRPTVPSPYQQINASSYVDRTATPEAIAERARAAADKLANDRMVAADALQRRGHQADRTFDVEHPLPTAEPHDRFTSTGAIDPTTGAPIILNTSTGASSVGQGVKPQGSTHNAEQAKERKRVELMAQGYETMRGNAQGIRQNAIAFAIHNPATGNLLLSKQEQNYLLGLRNFIAGEMHAESGARLSKDQLDFGFQRYGSQFGDKNASDKLNEARRALEGSQQAFGGGASSPAPNAAQDAPQGQPVTQAATPEQIQRAASDPAYKQFLIEKGVRF